jgi:hypothetical protein
MDEIYAELARIDEDLAAGIGNAMRIGVLPPLLMAHSLLGCKNVDTEDHRPDARLSKANVKRRGEPLVKFKTLTIRPMGGSRETGRRVELGGGQSSLHLVRGHFKTFSQERPLFGSIVGTYWWSPNVRGNAEVGTVVKDYSLDVSKNP